MGEVLSQNEIDSLLQALSTGELDVDEMKSAPEKSVTTTLKDRQSFQKSIFVRWKSYLNITDGFFPRIFRFICEKRYKSVWRVPKRLLFRNLRMR